MERSSHILATMSHSKHSKTKAINLPSAHSEIDTPVVAKYNRGTINPFHPPIAARANFRTKRSLAVSLSLSHVPMSYFIERIMIELTNFAIKIINIALVPLVTKLPRANININHIMHHGVKRTCNMLWARTYTHTGRK